MSVNPDRQARINRLKWHCRRALLELDIVFTRYWDRNNGDLPDDQEDVLRDLLAMEDHDLWAIVSGRVTPEGDDPRRDALLAELRSCHTYVVPLKA
jgi:antitoxin CptB